VKLKATSLIVFALLFTCMLAIPVQAESDLYVESNAALAKPTKKPAKTKKPKSTPVQNYSPTPQPTSTTTGTATVTATATHTSNPAFSPTASQTPSSTGTATHTPTSTNTTLPDQPAKTKTVLNPTSTVGVPSGTDSLSTSTTTSTLTLAPGLTPVFAGGLAITMPTGTPATPWLETVLAAVTQTENAAYKSPTPSSTSTPTATFTATPTVSMVVANENTMLNVSSVSTPTVQPGNTLFWMILYAACSLGFVAVVFMVYLKMVVFRKSG